MNPSAKSVVIVALAMGIVCPVTAQTSKFDGWSAHAAVGYQSIKPQLDNVVSGGDAMAVAVTTASSLVGTIGLEYTWALDARYVLAAGLDYGLNYGKNSELGVLGAVQDRVKVKQGVGFSVAPGMLVDKNTLAYLKFGYQGNTAKFESDGTTESGNAYIYGLGVKFLQKNDYFVFTELNYLAGKKKNLTEMSDTTGDIKATGYFLAAGVGKRF